MSNQKYVMVPVEHYPADEWIPSNGKKPKLPGGTRVDIRFADGNVEIACRASNWIWERYGASDDITHYRIHQPASAVQGEAVAWMHENPSRVDVIHAAVKKLLVDSRESAGHLHRPLDKSEHYTIPLYRAAPDVDVLVEALQAISRNELDAQRAQHIATVALAAHLKRRADDAEAVTQKATAHDYAVEHAEYMAKSAERLIAAIDDMRQAEADALDTSEIVATAEQFIAANEKVYAAHEAVTEGICTLQDRIYQFRKRADRAAAAPQPAEQHPASRPWSYCPECGSEHVQHHEGEHKQCVNCHQEWFSGIDYTDVVRKHLAGKFRDKDAEIERLRSSESTQPVSDVARLVEALEEARDLVDSWSAYASEYFKEKHNLARDLERLDAVIAAYQKRETSHEQRT